MTKNLCVVDPGHGGRDCGAVGGEGGLYEKAAALAIARMLYDELYARGFDVLMTRDSDEYLTLGERCRIANEAGADIFVSIHCNSSTNKDARGIETFHAQTCSQTAKDLAAAVQKRLIEATGARDRGVKSADYYVLKGTKAPAILVECGFISNSEEAQMLFKSSYQRTLAKAIADGVAAVLEA